MSEKKAPPASPRPEMFSLGAQAMLPAVCPCCGAPGVQPFDIPCLSGQPALVPLSEHLCDLCAEARQRSATTYAAWLIATMVLCVATAVALMLWAGTTSRATQLLLLLLVSLVFGVAAVRMAPERRRWELTFELVPAKTEKDVGRILLTWSPFLRKALYDSGATQLVQNAPFALRRLLPSIALFTLPLCAALAAWVLLQNNGTSTVRLLNGSDQRLHLLLDGALISTEPPLRFEDPRSGKELTVRAGKHRLTLIHQNGAVLAEQEVALSPGAQWIAGALPEASCLFVQTRDYAATSALPQTEILDFHVGFLELPLPIDAWFVPLFGKNIHAPTSALDTAEGTRTALRLLPCQGDTAGSL